ncbi:MAG: Type 1 glutamine amidotransferase-like domain-containing protein [Firmicutes bacterium]|nr:Type 1 glutamine amidotransferase-like domain-containing protein [Bacillota bacterium]
MNNLTFILASSFNSTAKDKNGNRYAVALNKHYPSNQFLDNVKTFTPNLNLVIYIANNPNDHTITDERGNLVFQSLKLSGLDFKKQQIIDNRNLDNAKNLILNADLILLAGGKLQCQLDSFTQLNLKELLKTRQNSNKPCLVIGGSAGAMNLCEFAFNFPESKKDLSKTTNTTTPAPDAVLLNGLGFHNEIIIPHFDYKTKTYGDPNDQELAELDLVNNHFIPQSHKHELLAFNDDGYILIRNHKPKYFGTFSKIKHGIVSLIQHNI